MVAGGRPGQWSHCWCVGSASAGVGGGGGSNACRVAPAFNEHGSLRIVVWNKRNSYHLSDNMETGKTDKKRMSVNSFPTAFTEEWYKLKHLSPGYDGEVLDARMIREELFWLWMKRIKTKTYTRKCRRYATQSSKRYLNDLFVR